MKRRSSAETLPLSLLELFVVKVAEKILTFFFYIYLKVFRLMYWCLCLLPGRLARRLVLSLQGRRLSLGLLLSPQSDRIKVTDSGSQTCFLTIDFLLLTHQENLTGHVCHLTLWPICSLKSSNVTQISLFFFNFLMASKGVGL